jgi:predicted enzyme related to lactoylglutathione lyase
MDNLSFPRIKKLSPQLLVCDIGRSIEFYTMNLGFEVDFRYEDFYAGIIKDGFSIHLKVCDSLIGARPNRRDNEHLDIVCSVEEIEFLHREILTKSVEVIQPLRDMPYGREFYIADPDGNIIAFVEEP